MRHKPNQFLNRQMLKFAGAEHFQPLMNPKNSSLHLFFEFYRAQDVEPLPFTVFPHL
jgi:hypothetical protein